MKAFNALFITELKLSLRGMDMIIFAICMPVVLIIILGSIYGSKPAFDGAEYTFLEQSFGAAAAIALCAAGVMGLPLVISDYRHKKILKRFRVTPASPVLLLLVQAVINVLYAVTSLILVYASARIFFGYRMAGSWIRFLGAYFLVMISIYSIGIMVGGIASSMKTANLLCSVLYFPMLVFSGATLPYEIMPPPLQRVADIMPLTQGIKLLKAASLGLPADQAFVPLLAMLLLAAACIAISIRFFKWE